MTRLAVTMVLVMFVVALLVAHGLTVYLEGTGF